MEPKVAKTKNVKKKVKFLKLTKNDKKNYSKKNANCIFNKTKVRKEKKDNIKRLIRYLGKTTQVKRSC